MGLVLVILVLLQLSAIEVVLDEQQSAVLDLLGSFNGRRLRGSILLDFGLLRF